MMEPTAGSPERSGEMGGARGVGLDGAVGGEMDGARGVGSDGAGGGEMDGARGVGMDGARVVGSVAAGSNDSVARVVGSAAAESNGAGGAEPRIQQAQGEGKTCHQCRQRKAYFAAACNNVKKKGQCPLTYCQNCLLNRYGEVADEVAQEEGWNCPKCRGECNCSMCRRKKGELPTGILAFAAKASGCSSVHDLLNKGSDMVAAAQMLVPVKVNGTLEGNPKRTLEIDAAADNLPAQGDDVDGISSVPASKKLKDKRAVSNSDGISSVPASKKLKDKRAVSNSATDEKSLPRTESLEIVLPRGTPITNIAGAELEPEDVGPALQFYEFCQRFAEIFDIKKGQPEKILQDITGRRELRVVPSLIVELHINMLSVIKKDRNEKPNYSKDGDNWVKDIGHLISKSTFISKELPVDCLNQGVVGYKTLSSSCKLHVLNFLCDETLSCVKLRKWIKKQNEKAAERRNAAREKIRAASEMEKKLKETQSDMAKGMPLVWGEEIPSVKETNDVILQIKEAKKAKQAAIKAFEEEVGGELWTKPVIVDRGVAYWKLDGYCNGATIVRQEFDNENKMNTMGNKDMWFMFTEDEEKVIGDYQATRSGQQSRNHT